MAEKTSSRLTGGAFVYFFSKALQLAKFLMKKSESSMKERLRSEAVRPARPSAYRK
jgi:hypothetical protein